MRYPTKKLTPETAIRRACIQYLRAKFGPRLWYFSVRGGIGQRPGIPDVVACISGRFYGLEFKNGSKGKVSDYQRQELSGITRAGGTALVIRSVEECVSYFQKLQGNQMEIF